MRLWDRIEDYPFKEDLRRVIKFHNPGFDCTKFSSFPNVEELLSQMMANEQLFDSSRQYEGKFTKKNLKDLQRDFLLEISDWFQALSEKVNPSEPRFPWLKAFRDRVRRENAVIISFNWDLILDQLLFGSDLDKNSYGFSKKPPEGPVLLKPHGSLNWFETNPCRFIKDSEQKLLFGPDMRARVYAFRKFNPQEPKSDRKHTPLIVPPVYLKNFEKPVFKELLQNCTKHWSIAKKK